MILKKLLKLHTHEPAVVGEPNGYGHGHDGVHKEYVVQVDPEPLEAGVGQAVDDHEDEVDVLHALRPDHVRQNHIRLLRGIVEDHLHPFESD